MKDEKDIHIEEISNNIEKENYKYKLIVVGDSGVGKTNLIKRFVTDTFGEDTKATVGVEFMYKTYKINNEILRVEIWDTAGQERYKSITMAYYKGAKGALIVYDITSAKTFEDIDKWIADVKEKAGGSLQLMIVGNKTDLESERAVTKDEALEKAKIYESPIMETSALDATNVKKAFEDLIIELYKDQKVKSSEQNAQSPSSASEGVKLETSTKKKFFKCC